MVPYALTFLIGLFVNPETGMIVGTCSHLCILVYTSGNPRMDITRAQVEHAAYVLVRPDRALFFPSVETIRTKLMAAKTKSKDVEAASSPEELPVILDFTYVCEMDYTAAKVNIVES